MICTGCGNENASRVRLRYVDGERIEVCDQCGSLRNLPYPDVYFREPYMDPNLVSPKDHNTPDGVWVRSKAHKSQLLREQGLREVGDRVHGAINYDKHIRH